ncbi:MAG: MBL fold metallo-hydrolase [Calditrichaeota bacterium]|nr:MBL fold metallo-hydrolase [Calditrichota bacterium]MCB9368931.1 MBL fold metallo-hydrolase [Calditrichota bacterium]
MFFRQIEDPYLAQYAYLIGCQETGEALLIDPERDIDRYVEIALRNNLKIVAVAETHIHADFVSGTREFGNNYPVRVYLSGEGGDDWQYTWEPKEPAKLFRVKHGDVFHVGNIEFEVVHTPGHTPEHICFMITDRGAGAEYPIGIISGDFVFVGDVGRPDLLESAAGEAGAKEPAAHELYRSLLEFFQFPDYLQVWPGHGAGSACGKALGSIPDTTVGYERRVNPSLLAAQSGEEKFVHEILHGQPEPPLYFAQMKKWNKQGPPLLPSEFKLQSIAPGRLPILASDSSVVIVDTRLDRDAFFDGHIPGSLWIPLTKSFPSYAGSLISAGQKIVVVCHDMQAELAVRLLWRVGLDNILGFVRTKEYETWIKKFNPKLTKLETVTFRDVLSNRSGEFMLDVRGESEFDELRLPDSVLIPHTRILSRLTEIPRDRRVVVYCSAGVRSSAVASLLSRLKYDVVAIAEGIEAAGEHLVVPEHH